MPDLYARLPRCCWLLTLLLVAASGAQAGVIRHDRLDSDYLALGAGYDSVGQVRFSQAAGSYLGSATLIAPNWALTAAHVVSDATSLDFVFGGSTFTATSWMAHSKWDGDLGKGYDIGLIHFEDDLESATGISAAGLYTGTDEVGKTAVAAGYGTTGTGLTGATGYDGQRRAGYNVVDTLLRTPGKDSRVLLSDFDNPLDPADSSWGDAVGLDLEYLIAPGDSGGGLFIDGLLAGVHSFGWGVLDGDPDSDYGDASGHTRVSSFIDWIVQNIDPLAGGGGSGGGGKGGGNGGGGGGKGGRPFFDASIATMDLAVPAPGTGLLGILGFALLGLHRARPRRAPRPGYATS